MKQLLSLFLLSFFAVVAYAQSGPLTFTGVVTDANGKSLASASVMLVNEKGSNIKFTKTDKTGHFSIIQPEGKTAAKLAFLCLGYARREISVGQYAKGDKKVALTEKVEQIREVEVKPEVFRIKGDTIAYSVAGLREKQDRTIEDVIGRIPGIRVDVSGQIYYRDKPINKFYVDGKDMAGDSYAMVSKNLSASKVDSVEVLQHHQPVNALRGKAFSEVAALNLVLKDGVKLHWTGTAEVGTGLALQKPWGWNRKLRLVEMFFGNKLQTISIYKHNNIGEDVSKEVSRLTYDKSEPGLLHNIGSIGTGKYGFNNSHLVATNWYAKTSKDANIRLQMSGLLDKSTFENYSERTYLDVGNATLVREQRTAQSYTNRWRAEADYTYNGAKVYVDDRVSGTLDYSHSKASTLLDGMDKQERVTPHKRNVANEFKMNLAPGSSHRHEVSSYFNYTFLPGRLRLYNGTDEQLNMKSLTCETDYDYTHSLFDKLNFSLNVSYDFDRKSEFVAYNDTVQSVSYTKNNIKLTPSVNYGNMGYSSPLYFSLNCPMGWLSRSILGDNDRRWYASPTANVGWNMTRIWQLSTSYSHSFTPSGFYEATPVRVYTSYNYAKSGTGQNNYSSGDNASVSLSNQSPGFGWSSRLTYSYSAQHFKTLYESTLSGGVYVRRNVSGENNTITHGVNARIGKNMRWLRTNVNLDCSCQWSSYQILLDGIRTLTHLRNVYAHLYLKMRPCRIFNFDETSSFNLSRQQVGQSKSLYRNFSHILNLYFQPGQWQLAVKSECRHSVDGSEKFNLYSSASLSYKTQAYELSLNCNNLFGTNKRESRSVSPLGTFYSITYLRPREVLASIVFNL